MSSNEWLWLKISCPICSNDYKTDYWAHINCPNNKNDHDLKINSSGYIKCEACGIMGELTNWNFSCGNNHGFESITKLVKLVEAFQIMANNETIENQLLMAKLIENISSMFLNNEKQFNNFKNNNLKCMPSNIEKNLPKNFNNEKVNQGSNNNNNIYININMGNGNINYYH